MGQFLKPDELKKSVKQLFLEAEYSVTIVSPYIKLDDTLKKKLEKQIHNPEFEVFILFGKMKMINRKV